MTAAAKQELVRELERRGLDAMAEKALAGEYSDFASSHAFPVIQLVNDLEAAGCRDLAERARNGDFDHDR